jgi:putative chitinase
LREAASCSAAAPALEDLMLLTTHQVQRVAVYAPAAKVAQLVVPLNAALPYGDIDSALRAAMFLAQTTHESMDFRFFTEIWGSTPAQLKYEGRKDLGNVEPGDGYRFRGRGAIQLTGRKNYTEAGAALALPLIEHPDLAAEADHAFTVAAWWWQKHGCNAPADKGDVEACTRIINGGLNGLMDRNVRYDRACEALGILPAV